MNKQNVKFSKDWVCQSFKVPKKGDNNLLEELVNTLSDLFTDEKDTVHYEIGSDPYYEYPDGQKSGSGKLILTSKVSHDDAVHYVRPGFYVVVRPPDDSTEAYLYTMSKGQFRSRYSKFRINNRVVKDSNKVTYDSMKTYHAFQVPEKGDNNSLNELVEEIKNSVTGQNDIMTYGISSDPWYKYPDGAEVGTGDLVMVGHGGHDKNQVYNISPGDYAVILPPKDDKVYKQYVEPAQLYVVAENDFGKAFEKNK